MTFGKIIVLILTTSIPLLITLYLNLQSNRTDQKVFDHKGELKVSKIYLTFGIILFIFPLIFLLGYILDPKIEYVGIFAFISFTLGLLGGWSLATYLNHRLSFDSDAFTVTDWKGTMIKTYWHEIEKAKHNPSSGIIHVYTEKNHIKISQYFIGLQQFKNQLKKKCEIIIS